MLLRELLKRRLKRRGKRPTSTSTLDAKLENREILFSFFCRCPDAGMRKSGLAPQFLQGKRRDLQVVPVFLVGHETQPRFVSRSSLRQIP